MEMLGIAVLVDILSHKKPESEEPETLCQTNSREPQLRKKNENGSRSLDEVSYIIAHKRLVYIQNNLKNSENKII